MNLVVAAAVGFALLTVAFFVAMVRAYRRRRLLRGSVNAVGGVAMATGAAAALSLLLTALTYHRLTHETTVARISFVELAPAEFEARLMVSGERDRFFVLAGDAWQIDARLITWKPPATILGLDPLYRLERLSGRYSAIADERESPRTVHSLADDVPLDLWAMVRRVPMLMPGVDAHYGNATFVPMADNAEYEVFLSRDALVARPKNPAAEAAVQTWR